MSLDRLGGPRQQISVYANTERDAPNELNSLIDQHRRPGPVSVDDLTAKEAVTRENVWVDFAMRYDRWYRPLATLLGVGPMWTKIQVLDGMLHIKHGWMFALDVPLTDIQSARLLTERPLAWGLHAAKDGWLVNGSRRGIVEVKFTQPVKPKTGLANANWLGANWPAGAPRAVYISVTEPDAFIAAVTSQREDDSAPPRDLQTETVPAAPPMRAMTITLWVAAVAASGVTAFLLATIIDGYVLAIRHKLLPNDTFGFRDATTRACLPAWYAAQQAGFSWLLIGGGPLLVFNMVFCVLAVIKRRSPWDVYAMFMGTLFLLLVVLVIAGLHADSVARVVTR